MKQAVMTLDDPRHSTLLRLRPLRDAQERRRFLPAKSLPASGTRRSDAVARLLVAVAALLTRNLASVDLAVALSLLALASFLRHRLCFTINVHEKKNRCSKNCTKKKMPQKRKREVVYTHCTNCGQPMHTQPCGIDWHAVYVAMRVQDHMTETGRIPSQEELENMDAGAGSDPCDDCCCEACGSRKERPGAVCC